MLTMALDNVRLFVERLHVTLEVGGVVVIDGNWPEVQDAPELRRLAAVDDLVRQIVEILDRSYREVNL